MKHLSLFTVLLLLAACETSFEADFPEHEPRLVVNAFFTAGELWEIDLSESVIVMDSLEVESDVTDATVEILRDGRVETVLQPCYANAGTEHERFYGTYCSETEQPEAGATYTLRASAPGLPPVEARDHLPVPCAFEMTVTDVKEEDEDVQATLTLRFTDAPAQDDYYLLGITAVDTIQQIGGGYRTWAQPWRFRSADPLLLGDSFDRALATEEMPRYREALFSDVTIDGQATEVQIRTRLRRDDWTAFVELRTVSEAYYAYKKSRRPLEEDFDITNPFAEPLQLDGNIEGGLGIFAGSSLVRREIVY